MAASDHPRNKQSSPSTSTYTSSDLEHLLLSASDAEANDRLVDALRAYRSVLDLDPRSEPALLGVGRISLLFEKYEEALIDFTAVLTRNPLCAEAFRGRGLCYFNTGLPDKGLADLSRAVSLAPSDPEPLLSLGQIALELDLFDQAESALRSALALSPSDPDISLDLARCLLLSSHPALPDIALLLSSSSQSFGSDDPLILLLSAELHARHHRHGLARRLLAQALHKEPELTEDAFRLPALSQLLLADN